MPTRLKDCAIFLGEGQIRDRDSGGGWVKAELADADLQGRLNDVSLRGSEGVVLKAVTEPLNSVNWTS